LILRLDCLFLPLSWHTKSQAIIDTATPGKMTDYLISGSPILIHAPASTFLVKYARENNFAEIVDTEEKINKFLPVVNEMLEQCGRGGMITTEKVNVLFYQPKK